VGLEGTSHVNYTKIKLSGCLRRNGKLQTYPPEVKRMAASV
jgi:hypothetical protein